MVGADNGQAVGGKRLVRRVPSGPAGFAVQELLAVESGSDGAAAGKTQAVWPGGQLGAAQPLNKVHHEGPRDGQEWKDDTRRYKADLEAKAEKEEREKVDRLQAELETMAREAAQGNNAGLADGAALNDAAEALRRVMAQHTKSKTSGLVEGGVQGGRNFSEQLAASQANGTALSTMGNISDATATALHAVVSNASSNGTANATSTSGASASAVVASNHTSAIVSNISSLSKTNQSNMTSLANASSLPGLNATKNGSLQGNASKTVFAVNFSNSSNMSEGGNHSFANTTKNSSHVSKSLTASERIWANVLDEISKGYQKSQASGSSSLDNERQRLAAASSSASLAQHAVLSAGSPDVTDEEEKRELEAEAQARKDQEHRDDRARQWDQEAEKQRLAKENEQRKIASALKEKQHAAKKNAERKAEAKRKTNQGKH